MFGGVKQVWAPDGREGFRLGKVVDIGSDAITVETADRSGKPIVAPYDRVFAAEDNNNKEYDDNCSLMYLNEATLLHNLRLRYRKNKIYTYVANILIAVNPYQAIQDLYSNETIRSYKGKSLGVLPPHVYAIADKAYRDMKVWKQSQSIIVSGESGAGKTESTKHILRYLAETCGNNSSGNVERRIVEANPLLEAFGNAKTLRNLNSSRFGKYVEVHFSDKVQMVGGFISHYLLEKSRVCHQNPGERNFHIFYRLCMGAPNAVKSSLKLGPPSSFAYLNKSSLTEPDINDVNDFTRMEAAMDAVGLRPEQKLNIYRVVAAVLHLGNIEFQESSKDKKGGSELTPTTEPVASDVAKLLGVLPDELQMSLTTRLMITTKGGGMGTLYKVPLQPQHAAAGRDALAKAIYNKLFDYIVSCVNQCFPFQSSTSYIGVLDIAGFEFFEVNSFEQFCINYCNEKLQQFFNERILKEEQQLYDKEGLGVKSVSYVDNQDCIDLFENKRIGIMDLLDEEMKLPKPSEVHFTNEVHAQNSKHFRLAVPRKSHLSIHRSVKDDQGFLIRHFAGAVCYQTPGFLEKNNDALHDSLLALVHESKDPFIQSLFPPETVPAGGKNQAKKLAFDSVGKKFKSQLSQLMEKLRGTGSSFIRCIKPNDEMKSNDFEGGQILSQLQCAGMVSVLELMQEGFPSRTAFAELYDKYKSYLPSKLARLDPRTFCKALFRAVGMNKDEFKFGTTKVFFRPGKFAEFDQIMRSDPAALSALVSKVMTWIIRNRWRRAIWCALSVQKLASKIKYRRMMLIKIQKTVKMFIAVRKNRPRYKGIVKIRKLEVQVGQLELMVANLKKDKEKFAKNVAALKSEVSAAIKSIKTNPLREKQINAMYQDIFNKVTNQLNQLKSHKAAQEEQERLRKIQEQIDIEKRQKEEEEKKAKEDEAQRKVRAEQETKLKKELENAEKKRKVDEEKTKALLVKMKRDNELAEHHRSAQEAQERRDYELALRLAADPATMVSEERAPLKRNVSSELDGGKFEYLRKWKYADLRDTINTSCDLEMLEACRIEFHRRLKVYHAWRKNNIQKSKGTPVPQRAPADIMKTAEELLSIGGELTRKGSKKGGSKLQRYFRVPFSKPSDQYRDAQYTKSGWWYAHFDGEWIARQLEIHPNGALLLIAGQDDMDMCELSLTETKLLERLGAEITGDEFDETWKSYGGKVDRKFVGVARK